MCDEATIRIYLALSNLLKEQGENKRVTVDVMKQYKPEERAGT